MDSLSQQAAKDSVKEKKRERNHRWFAGISGGSMIQDIVLKGDQTTVYTTTNTESSAGIKSSDLSPTLVLAGQISRLWEFLPGLSAGPNLRLTSIHQRLNSTLGAGVNSASRFEYSADSLQFRAISLSETGEKSYQRTTLLTDISLHLEWKPKSSPFGLSLQWALVRYLGTVSESGKADDGLLLLGKSNPSGTILPDLRLFYETRKKYQIYLQTSQVQWKTAALPVPVKNEGTGWLISVGVGRSW